MPFLQHNITSITWHGTNWPRRPPSMERTFATTTGQPGRTLCWGLIQACSNKLGWWWWVTLIKSYILSVCLHFRQRQLILTWWSNWSRNVVKTVCHWLFSICRKHCCWVLVTLALNFLKTVSRYPVLDSRTFELFTKLCLRQFCGTDFGPESFSLSCYLFSIASCNGIRM